MPCPRNSTRKAAKQRELDKQKSLEDSKAKKKRWKKVVLKTPKVNKKKKEERLKKKRENARISRQKVKEDPSKHEAYLQAERARYQERVSSGKKKKRGDLSEREVKLVRRKDRERKKLERLKKKEGVNSEVLPTSYDSPDDGITRPQAKKKVNKRQKKCYSDNRRIRNENENLKKKLNTTRKRLERLSLKQSSKSSFISESPKSKTDAFLSTNPPLGEVRKRLIFGEALKQDIKSRYESTRKNAEKQYLAKLVRGRIIKKYRLLSEVKRNVTPELQDRISDDSDWMLFRKKEKTAVDLTTTTIVEFYEENSTIDPGKQAFVKIGEEKIQKRYLNASKIDLYCRFCSIENIFQVGYTTFAKYCPPYCVAPKITERDTTACYQHENFSLLVQSLHQNAILKENSTEKIFSGLLCDHRTDECFTRKCSKCEVNNVEIELAHKDFQGVITYKKWVTQKETRISGKTKKDLVVQVTKKELFNCKISNLAQLFFESLGDLLEHECRIFHQYRFWKNLKNGLTPQDLLLHFDFSQNWEGKLPKETHAMHFGASRPQFTLHTGMLYSALFNQGFVTASESLRHDAVAVVVHVIAILDFYLPQLPDVINLHFMSDGPTTQYRNRYAIHLFTQILPKMYPQIKTLAYHFSEKSHGKGPPDGMGASAKRVADDQVKYGTDIMDLDALVTALKNNVKKIHISSVTGNDIRLFESNLDQSLAKPFKGMTKVHQYTWNCENPEQVFLSTMSCAVCPPGTKCEHYSIGQLDYSKIPDSSKKRKLKSDGSLKKNCKRLKIKCLKEANKDCLKKLGKKRQKSTYDDDGSRLVKKPKKMSSAQDTSAASLPKTSNLRRTSRIPMPSSRLQDI